MAGWAESERCGDHAPPEGGATEAEGRGFRLERGWSLWHHLMKEHAHLDAWLRLAEQTLSCSDSAHLSFTDANEHLRTIERLRCEAGPRLVQLDLLTQRSAALRRVLASSARARLRAALSAASRRCHRVAQQLEVVGGRLKLFVSEWEEFEAEGVELILWLTNLDGRLSEVQHLNGNTCCKLRHLQSLQQCVCESWVRVNAQVSRGAALTQRGAGADAQRTERHLVELLRHCSRVYDNITHTHTRLLSMRLVLEEDLFLSAASDSGCPSESEGALDKLHLDVPALLDFTQSDGSDGPLPPGPEHLEWDPSVDVGPTSGDGFKTWSFLSGQSDISNDITANQEEHLCLRWRVHAPPSLSAAEGAESGLSDHWGAESAPDQRESEPMGFDEGRVRAWLRVQSPAPSETSTSCSRLTQEEEEEEEEEEEAQTKFPGRSVAASDSAPSSSSLRPLLLLLLLAVVALLLMMSLTWLFQDWPCHRCSCSPGGLHLTLSYVNGPPPT